MSTPHIYDPMCVCHSCVAKRHPANPKATRARIRDGQAEARKVGRYAFPMLDIEQRKDGRQLTLSRSGAAYERTEHTNPD